VGAFVGAYLLRPLMMGADGFGEMVFYGGLFGGMLGMLVYCLVFQADVLSLFDIYAPAVLIGHFFGRVGCFLHGCCYGVETAAFPFAVTYPQSSLSAPSGIPLVPVPLIEAAFLLVMFVFVTYLYLRTDKKGLCAVVYFASYAAARFVLEFFRGDDYRGVYLGFSTSQAISVLILVMLFVGVRMYGHETV
jgi:phosphatidylglycerol:prolipoprotein diacylglycerol transferase